VHKADYQPDGGKFPDHVAVDDTVIQLHDERYWLYAAVDPETNELLHTKLEPTRTNVLAHAFFTQRREKHDVDDVSRRGPCGAVVPLVVELPLAGCVDGDGAGIVDSVDVVRVAALVEGEQRPAIVLVDDLGRRWEVFMTQPALVGEVLVEIEALAESVRFLGEGVDESGEVPGAERDALRETAGVRNREGRGLLAGVREQSGRVPGELAVVVASLVLERARFVEGRVARSSLGAFSPAHTRHLP
jgi:hypothetical protein